MTATPAPASGRREAEIEGRLGVRVLDALLREDYGGLRGHIVDGMLLLPGGPAVRLRGPSRAASASGVHAGFLADLVVHPDQRLRPAEVLAAVRRLADPRDDFAAFERECYQTLAALLAYEPVRPSVLARLRRVPRTGAGPYYDVAAADTDHPVHPTGRARAGLDQEDLRRYAPEYHPAFRLRWAAVPRARITAVGARPGWWPDPAAVGLDRSPARDLFPVHPLTARALPDGAVLGPEPHLEVAPTLSMRTVVVDGRTHLKMPLPTSTLGLRNRRAIEPGTLPDGALVERILRRVLARERRLPVLTADEQTYGHAGDPLLGYLVRRLPAETAGAHVLPVAALLAEEPDGGRVIERWDVRELFGAYLDVLFRWNVTLFRHGIALEAHQQNVSIVLPPGTPPGGLRLLVKDNDGALIDPDRLNAALGTRISRHDFHDPRLATSDPEALARVFVTITVHLCAGALAFGLAGHGLLALRQGLGLVRERLDAALGPGDGFLRARTLDADRLPTKAMVTAGTLVDKARTGAQDINKHYGPPGPNYLQDDSCC